MNEGTSAERGVQRCPCGSGDVFGACCGPILAGRPAPTAERLMRSRYTAFAIGDTAYLRRSWHPSTRPASIELDPDVRWLRLDILAKSAGGPFDAEGIVEFEAIHRDASGRGVLHERSRFMREDGNWFYVDGEVS
ncbi:MAG: YchJ family protein [Microbacterium sp.]|jgi:SEC-C motif-containing protein|uniref:YchJ family protein n=1 Tax=Microbacterium sp. TaxID=51671 RepID=UPI002816EA7D|nr:YchJ family protein [Microbacterium sp.]MDR2321487.1 YchJ family protein [Microbacterium sp.]